MAVQVEYAYTKAALGILDPVTGTETFSQIEPLSIAPWQPGMADALFPLKRLNEDAHRRGANTPEMLKLNRIASEDLVGTQIFLPPSWTGDVPKKKDK